MSCDISYMETKLVLSGCFSDRGYLVRVEYATPQLVLKVL